MFVLPDFVCLGSNLSYTGRILRENITTACDSEAGVLLFGVILYTWRDCWRAFSVGVALTFFKALFKVSTNRSASPFNRRWNEAVVTWSIWYDSQKFLNSLDVNWLPLSDTMISTTPNLANSSWRIFCDFCDWVFSSMYFGLIWATVDYNGIIKSFQRGNEVNVYPRPWKVCLWQGVEFNRRCLRIQRTAFA